MYTVQAPNDVVALDAVTGRVFWTYSYSPSPQSRPCCGRVNRGVAIVGRHAVHGDHRRPSDRARRQERPSVCGIRTVAKAGSRLCHHARAAGDQRQSDRRRGRRRIRHPRFHRGLRRSDRQRSLALLHHSRARRARSRDLGGRFLENRRRIRMGDRLLRSRAQSHAIGESETRARITTATSARATICTAVRSSRWMPIPASSNGITSSRRTTSSTTTPCRFRCWPTSNGRVSLAK